MLLFVQTLIGFGIGPWAVGQISDWLRPSGISLPLLGVVGQGADSLRWGMVIVGLINVWAAAHYFRGHGSCWRIWRRPRSSRGESA